MLSVVMLDVSVLSVTMLTVEAPSKGDYFFNAKLVWLYFSSMSQLSLSVDVYTAPQHSA
jgi:hypothetical protein